MYFFMDDVARAVDDFIVVGKNRIFGKARDLRAVDGDILMFRDVVVPVEGDVLNQFFHRYPSPLSRDSSICAVLR